METRDDVRRREAARQSLLAPADSVLFGEPRPRVRAIDGRGGHPVNRNAPCPCGSGKKFKRCHRAVVT